MSGRAKRGGLNGLDTLLAFALIVVVAFIGYRLLLKPGERAGKTAGTASVRQVPVREVQPGRELPAVVPDKAPAIAYRARVAVIIDDLGTDMAALEKILAIDAPLAISVLPLVGHSEASAARAGKAGREVLLHLPMQPRGESTKGLGPGALMSGMGDDAFKKAVSGDLESVPGAIGVNNHMGSALTEDESAMAAVMEVLHARGLFFIDSKTSSASRALIAARQKGVRASSRNVFLDDSDDPAEIQRQFDRMVKLALRDGEAIAIGHPRPNTIEVLRRELPGLKEKGIEVVRVSSLVR